MAKEMPVEVAFKRLDTELKGFLTLRSFHANFGKMFGFYLKGNEVIALFKEIDKDEDSIVYFSDLSEFYKTNFVKRLSDIQKEKNQKNT